jgi:Nucleotidyl transferase of unknown function (DUF2204)
MSQESSIPAVATSITSSAPPLLEADQEKLYRDVIGLLNEHHVPYTVAGAFALQQYTGIWRSTKDLDVFLCADHQADALKLLGERGFACETCDPVWLAKAHRGDYFVDLITGMSNAVIVVDRSWMERAHPAMVLGIPTRILAPEELLTSKLFVARRERFDGADIAHIIYGTKGRMEWDRILQLVGDHWEVLLWSLILFRYVYPGQTDYVPLPLWQDLLSRYMHVVSNPNPQAKFRGSLIDDNMFSIDVKEWGLPDVEQQYRAQRIRRKIACS